jgi:hypothetical protein
MAAHPSTATSGLHWSATHGRRSPSVRSCVLLPIHEMMVPQLSFRPPETGYLVVVFSPDSCLLGRLARHVQFPFDLCVTGVFSGVVFCIQVSNCVDWRLGSWGLCRTPRLWHLHGCSMQQMFRMYTSYTHDCARAKCNSALLAQFSCPICTPVLII